MKDITSIIEVTFEAKSTAHKINLEIEGRKNGISRDYTHQSTYYTTVWYAILTRKHLDLTQKTSEGRDIYFSADNGASAHDCVSREGVQIARIECSVPNSITDKFYFVVYEDEDYICVAREQLSRVFHTHVECKPNSFYERINALASELYDTVLDLA